MPSRRTLAKGAAWAAPVVAVAATAPAFAASQPPVVSGSICQLFYGGGTINYQTHSMYLGVKSSTGIIPAGTVLSWNICVSGGGSGTGGTNEVPTTNYSATAAWTLSLSQTSGNAITGGCFTATITFNQNYTTGAGPGGTWCAAALLWTDIYSIRPGASVSATSNAPTGPVTSGGSGTLTYTAARRHPTSINSSGRTPHYYLTRSGTQNCYPAVQYSVLLSNTGYDNVTCYPSGTTVANPCNWDGLGCVGTTGLCAPREGGVQGGQYTQPQLC